MNAALPSKILRQKHPLKSDMEYEGVLGNGTDYGLNGPKKEIFVEER